MTDFSKLSDYIIGIRRTLHKHPELSGQEFQTQQLIRSELDKLGIPHRTLHKTDILAEIAGLQTRPGETTSLPPEKHSKTVLLRADLDALPVTENSDAVSYTHLDIKIGTIIMVKNRTSAGSRKITTAFLFDSTRFTKNLLSFYEGDCF